MQSVEDRFLRHIAESEGRLRSEMQAGFLDLQRQMGVLRADVSREIADVSREIADVRKEIAEVRKEVAEVRKEVAEVRKELTAQTRWILTVMVGAAVLIPTLQRVMVWLFP